MNQTKREQAVVIFLYTIMVVLITVNVTYYCMQNGINGFKVRSAKTNAPINYKELNRELKKVRDVINNNYVEKNIDEKALMEGAVKGYVSGLGDKYTEYYTGQEWKEISSSFSGEYKGIGVVLSQNDEEQSIITKVMPNTPAEKAGILAEDKLIQINGQKLKGKTLDEVAGLLKGKENTSVKLVIERIEDDKKQEKEIEVERKEIQIDNTSSKMLKNNIGYIRIESFDEHIHKDFEKAYNELHKKGMKKLIIDVRLNGGGDLRSTTKLLELLLPKNTLIYSTQNKDGKIEEIRTKEEPKISDEIIILGNKYSASASEILISALIDNNRAKFVGEKTFGKGVIQTVLPFKYETGLLKDGVLKITTEEYKRANGEKIHKLGIKPQIEVKIKREDAIKKIDTQLEKAQEILGGKNNE